MFIDTTKFMITTINFVSMKLTANLSADRHNVLTSERT
jgi:hypothetical protein